MSHDPNQPADHENPTAAHEHNRAAWDRLARQKHRFTQAARDEELADPLGTVDPAGWLGGDIAGQRVLCLGAGGGRQSALYAAAGGRITVVDISPAQLELDRQVASERGYEIRTVEASIDWLPMLAASEFDLVIQPVSSCYVPSVRKVYREVARVLRAGGLYISQHKQPASLQSELTTDGRGYVVAHGYYRTGPLPAVRQATPLREEGTLEFLHRWEELLGGLCQSGFVIEDIVEPCHAQAAADPGTQHHRGQYLPPYVRIKARRRGEVQATRKTSSLLLP